MMMAANKQIHRYPVSHSSEWGAGLFVVNPVFASYLREGVEREMGREKPPEQD